MLITLFIVFDSSFYNYLDNKTNQPFISVLGIQLLPGKYLPLHQRNINMCSLFLPANQFFLITIHFSLLLTRCCKKINYFRYKRFPLELRLLIWQIR